MSRNNKKVYQRSTNTQPRKVEDKKKQLRNQIYCWILVFLMVVWSFGSVLGLIAFFRSKDSAAIQASAESVETYATQESYGDYETANILSYPYTQSIFRADVVNIWGVQNTDLGNGAIKSVGTSVNAPLYFSLQESFSWSLPAGTYTSRMFVDGVLSNPNSLRLYTVVGDNYLWGDSTFTITEEEQVEFLGFVFMEPTSVNATVRFMLSKGTENYPYMPSYDMIEYPQYNDGYDTGYNNGLEFGLGTAKYGVFSNVEFTAYALSDSTLIGSFSGNSAEEQYFTSNGLDMQSIYTVLGDSYRGYFNRWQMELTFVDSAGVMLSDFKYFTGNASNNFFNSTLYLISASNQEFSFTWYYDETRGYWYLNDTSGVFTSNTATVIKTMRISNLPIDITGAVVFMSNGQYNIGYDKGFNDGLTSSQGYLDGFNAGKAQGLVEGEKIGLESSNKYTFTALLSSVFDVPVSVFTSLFNFEVLGINLTNFFLSIFTICVILAVVKLFM